jgi:hypothetical protein
MNVQSFDDYEKTSLDLQLCFLKSLFEWIINAFFYVSSFVDFCELFLILDMVECFLLYTSRVLGLCPLFCYSLIFFFKVQWKADIICLQETKLELISNNVVRSL